MPLFNARLIEKNIKNPKPLPVEHEAVLTAWAENLAKGIYDSETKNDGQFIQRILVDVLGYSESAHGSTWTVQKNQPVGKGNVDVALGELPVPKSISARKIFCITCFPRQILKKPTRSRPFSSLPRCTIL